ncbi:MAG: hypothetical protein ACRCZF_24385 [Gemmataceae bacterium]
MSKRLLVLGLVAGLGAFGCDSASSAKKDSTKKVDDAIKASVDSGKGMADKMKDGASGMADKAKDGVAAVTDKAKEVGEKAKEMGKEALEITREKVMKPVTEAMPKIEEKIKGLSGDAMTKAKTQYDALKKMVEEFKAAPGEKLGEIGEKITTALAELKKSLGL